MIQDLLNKPNILRYLVGAALGAWTGLVYGAVATNVNLLFIRDVPLHYEPARALGSILLAVLSAAVLGFIVNISHDSFRAIVVTSFLAGLTLVALNIYNSLYSIEKLVSALFLLAYAFLPLVILLLPFNALLRWSTQQILNAEFSFWTWMRMRSVLLCTFLALLVGVFAIYPDNGHQMMRKMDDYVSAIQNGNQQLPYVLEDYKANIKLASTRYTIDWSDDLRRYPAPLFYEDTTATLRLNVVSVYFSSGQSLYCLFREVDRNIYLCMMLEAGDAARFRSFDASQLFLLSDYLIPENNR